MPRKFFSSAAIPACAITLAFACAAPMFANWPPSGPNPPRGVLFVSNTPNNYPCPANSYPEIEAAVAAANPGATIYVCPGTYVVPVNINKPLTIVAGTWAMLQPTTLPAPATNRATGEPIYPMLWFHDVSWGQVQIINLTIDGSNFPPCTAPCQEVGILGQNAFGQLLDNTVRYVNLAGSGDGFGIFLQGAPGQNTLVQVQGNSVHDYLSSGIIANEQGTVANLVQNSVHGVGEASSIAQSGMQIGYGAQGDINLNVVTDNTGPAPHCQGTASSVNILSQQAQGQQNWWGWGWWVPNAQIHFNVSGTSEIGIGDVSDQIHIMNNAVSDSFCVGVYVSDNNNQIHWNTISHTCNPSVSPCSNPTTSSSTGIYVVSGNNNDVSNNTINEATYGISSTATTTIANNESIFNVPVQFAGSFQSYSMKSPPGNPFFCWRR